MRSYNERKTRRKIKKTQVFLFFSYFSLTAQKILPPFLFVPDYCVPSDNSVKKECVNGYQLLRHSVITERSPYHFPCCIKNQKFKIQNTNNWQIFVVNKEKTACGNL